MNIKILFHEIKKVRMYENLLFWLKFQNQMDNEEYKMKPCKKFY